MLLSEDASVVKITDLRNMSIVDPDKVKEVLLSNSFALSYMPPEAMTAHPEFGPPVDIFSFGHLALYTMLKTLPGNILPKFYSEISLRNVHVRTELERRKRYLDSLEDLMDSHSPIVTVIKKCLDDSPHSR